ncbi:hypothetical protein Ddc_17980 [Ditylenchus destructor]|nr:hypothetical protein Ddc_17980 [Ditylenchus destructor]
MIHSTFKTRHRFGQLRYHSIVKQDVRHELKRGVILGTMEEIKGFGSWSLYRLAEKKKVSPIERIRDQRKRKSSSSDDSEPPRKISSPYALRTPANERAKGEGSTTPFSGLSVSPTQFGTISSKFKTPVWKRPTQDTQYEIPAQVRPTPTTVRQTPAQFATPFSDFDSIVRVEFGNDCPSTTSPSNHISPPVIVPLSQSILSTSSLPTPAQTRPLTMTPIWKKYTPIWKLDTPISKKDSPKDDSLNVSIPSSLNTSSIWATPMPFDGPGRSELIGTESFSSDSGYKADSDEMDESVKKAARLKNLKETKHYYNQVLF